MKAFDSPINRRTLLRGVGVAMALPWLESLPVWGGETASSGTPAFPRRFAALFKGGVSMDQLLAHRLGEESPQPSLVLGCEQPITGYHETNFSMAYSSHISWQDAASPVPMEVYPSLAFDSLFDNQGNKRALSIL